MVMIAVGMIASGLTWIFGPWGLVGTGAILGAAVLVFVNEREE